MAMAWKCSAVVLLLFLSLGSGYISTPTHRFTANLRPTIDPYVTEPAGHISCILPSPFHRKRIHHYSQTRKSILLLDSKLDHNDRFHSASLLSTAGITLRRTTWLSWWGQVILTTVSSVTLLFAKSVIDARPLAQRSLLPGAFVFAGTGIGLSILSILLTAGGTRLSRRILRAIQEAAPITTTSTTTATKTVTGNPQDAHPWLHRPIQVAQSIRKVIRVGTYLNLMGMLVTLIGAEQIIGLLAARVLTTATTATTMGVLSSTSQVLQPLDILIVQANTNTLLSHFVSLVCTLYLTFSVHQLDPPSTDED
jgi:hypothetical protein